NVIFFFSSRRRHTRSKRDWSSDVCSSDLSMNYFNVGKIVNTQGLQGEMRVLSVTDFTEERFKKGSKLAIFDDKDQFLLEVEIASHRKQKNFDIVKFKGMYHINDIEKYK